MTLQFSKNVTCFNSGLFINVKKLGHTTAEHLTTPETTNKKSQDSCFVLI